MARQSKNKQRNKKKTAQPDSFDPILLNSIFELPEEVSGRLVVSGSPGALIPATLASRSGANAMLFHDAGGGRREAAVEGIAALGEIRRCSGCSIAPELSDRRCPRSYDSRSHQHCK